MILECLVLLCQKRNIRNELRKLKVYPIIRNVDLNLIDKSEELHDQFSDIIRKIVDFLMGDEEPLDI